MAPLVTLQDYVNDVRALILDTVSPYRYSDADVISAFNMMLLETRRVRPDLFVTRWGSDVPYFQPPVSGAVVPMEPQFRLGYVYGTVAHLFMRDDEDTSDARANSFNEKFHDILLGTKPRQFRQGRAKQGGQGGQQEQQQESGE